MQLEPASAQGVSKEAFDEAKSQFGTVINLFKVLGHAPNTLKGLLDFHRQLSESTKLDKKTIELVAILVSALNHCDYCVNVHMAVGLQTGLSKDELLLALEAKSKDTKIQSILQFTNEVVRNRGKVSEEILSSVYQNGFNEKALLEIIGIIGFYTTLQYVRHVANPDNDFPIVEEFKAHKHGA